MEKEQRKNASLSSKIKSWVAHLEIKIAIKTGVAAALSLITGLTVAKLFQRPDVFVSGLWSVLASIVVMQAYLGGTYRAAWIRFLGVLVGSIIGAIFITYVGHDAISLALSIFSTIVLCSILNLKESFRIASLSTAVIVVSAGLKPDIAPWIFSLYRFIDSCIGILIAVAVAHIIWPERAVENLRINISKALGSISKYYRIAANIENKTDEASAEYLHDEITELLENNQNFSKEAKLELLNKEFIGTDLNLITSQLDDIFSSIISLKNINKEVLSKIIDDSLAKAINSVIDKTELTFKQLERNFALEKTGNESIGLDQALSNLNQELLRFRETRITRKFNLEDVENFYVYFHDLRSIGEAANKLNTFQ